jgi:hypothetical protein
MSDSLLIRYRLLKTKRIERKTGIKRGLYKMLGTKRSVGRKILLGCLDLNKLLRRDNFLCLVNG